MPYTHVLGAIALALLAATNAYCDVYKWVDSDGTVHYSDQPAPGATQEQTLNIRSGTAADAESGAQKAPGTKSYIEQDAEFRKRQVEAEEKQVKEEKALADAKQRQQNCQRALDSLHALQSGARVTRTNDKGEREYLDDNQRQEEIANAQKSADSWCNPPK
ncbi:MAG TPA: DUF4124 domain-containing protein [Burkholderiales bacterium]|nr:DUF4124 domain-containing protein [Burkholderiales bacterium]